MIQNPYEPNSIPERYPEEGTIDSTAKGKPLLIKLTYQSKKIMKKKILSLKYEPNSDL